LSESESGSGRGRGEGEGGRERERARVQKRKGESVGKKEVEGRRGSVRKVGERESGSGGES